MTVIRRSLFWKIYLTLLASLVVTTLVLGAVFWSIGEAQREAFQPPAEGDRKPWPRNLSVYAKDGTLLDWRGQPVPLSETPKGRRWGPHHVLRFDLPGGRFVLTRFGPPPRARVLRLLTLMLVVVGGVGLAAYPITAGLTRRLERLRAGMTRWGETTAPPPLDERGSDEVALLARTFNVAAGRIDALLAAQKALLANASHELRSPLARLRMAVEVGLANAKPELHAEIVQNLAEMDQLVDELLLSSRLDHEAGSQPHRDMVDLLGLCAEEAAHVDAAVEGDPVEITGDAVLLRRMVRNLLENAAKHGRPPIAVTVAQPGEGGAMLTVEDAGDGVPAAAREKIFEPFYRPAGSSETAGGWGLGLALVRQIARLHDGDVTCEAAPSGGSRFTVRFQPSVAGPIGTSQ